MSTAFNTNLAKIQYELLGMTPDQIAKEHGVPIGLIDYAIQQHKWAPVALVQDIDQTDLEEQVTRMESKLNLVHTMRQGILDPAYIQIEAAITSKTLEVIQSIPADEASAAARLKTVTDILSTLRPTKAMIKAKGDGDGQQGIKVLIMNKVGGDINGAAENEVEVVLNGSALPPPEGV